MKTIKRRRLAGKTDYLKRLKLLKGSSPRVVFRKTNKYIIAQYVASKEAQDTVKLGVSSEDLMEYGWPEEFRGSLKSIPATYLTGYLIGKKIAKSNLETSKIIVDFGMIRVLHKTKTYAFLKGLVDSGVNIKCDKEFFPEEDKILGKNMKKDFSANFEKIKLNIGGL